MEPPLLRVCAGFRQRDSCVKSSVGWVSTSTGQLLIIFRKPQTNLFPWLHLRSKCLWLCLCPVPQSTGIPLRNQRGKAALPCRAVCLACFDKPCWGLWQVHCSFVRARTPGQPDHLERTVVEVFRLSPSQPTAKLSGNYFIVKDYLQRTLTPSVDWEGIRGLIFLPRHWIAP